MRRPVLIAALALVALAGAASVQADDPPDPQPNVITEGVTISGLDVGGLRRSEAVAAVEAWFARPIKLRFGDRRLRAQPTLDLRARANEWLAAKRAASAASGTEVRLPLTVSKRGLRRYAARIGNRFAKKPRNSVLSLRRLRPHATKARPGLRVRERELRLSLRKEILTHTRGPIWIHKRAIWPKITRGTIGPVIVIRRESKRLHLYRGVKRRGGMKLRRVFGVATGQAQFPSPLGRFTIVTMQRNPWWYPPDSDWAAGAQPIPPGPGNPLGTRWMGLSVGGVGIHGTPDAASIGYSASHGCIRMRIPEAEWLFERVRIGTTVFIVGA
jgi:lipoprotein-anchoring transpeptidase ErfK/SrfK